MERGSNTRSSLLWEVERILFEMKEINQLPDILLMENVPQVIGQKNIHNFKAWEDALNSLGYESYTKVLNASDYGIPQHRERCFMLSIRNAKGKYYTFPKTMKLDKVLEDLLEKNVPKHYFLSEKKIEDMLKWKSIENPFDEIERERVISTLTSHCGKDCSSIQLVKDYENQECN